MESICRIPIDFGEGGLPKAVFAKQYDANSRILELEPFLCGKKMTIDSDVTAYLQLTKPDGKTVVSECTVESGIISAPLSPSALSTAGVVKAEIALYRSNSVISSHIFHIRVEAAAYSSKACESSEEYNIFLKAISRAESAVSEAEKCKDDASEAIKKAQDATAAAEVVCADIQTQLSLYDEKLMLKQDKLIFDDFPTEGSKNPVTSGGVRDAILKSSVTPVAKTEEMTGEVGIDENGRLWFDPLSAVPFEFESFTVDLGRYQEKGSDVRSFSLNYKTNKTPESVVTVSTWQYLDGKNCTPLIGTSGNLLVTVEGNTPPLFTVGGDIYLKATYRGGEYRSKSIAIFFVNRIFMGAAASGDISDAMLNGLSVNKLASGKALTSTVTAGEGEYVYYACPASYGAPTFKVGGFEGGFELVDGGYSYTNPSGFTEAYQVWRSVNVNLGTITVAVS